MNRTQPKHILFLFIVDTTWQDTEVRKSLLAVSGVADKGNAVWFDSQGSCILPAGSPALRPIREITARATDTIALERQGGTYKLKTWRVPKSHRLVQGFTRQGTA